MLSSSSLDNDSSESSPTAPEQNVPSISSLFSSNSALEKRSLFKSSKRYQSTFKKECLSNPRFSVFWRECKSAPTKALCCICNVLFSIVEPKNIGTLSFDELIILPELQKKNIPKKSWFSIKNPWFPKFWCGNPVLSMNVTCNTIPLNAQQVHKKCMHAYFQISLVKKTENICKQLSWQNVFTRQDFYGFIFIFVRSKNVIKLWVTDCKTLINVYMH